jgi:predicted RNase H-like HicB family nuclease
MHREFTVIIEKGDSYYIGYCPEVPGANGQGETIDECRDSVREAIRMILDDRLEDGLRGAPDGSIRETIVVE